MRSTTTPARVDTVTTATATVTRLHTDPCLVVTIKGVEFRLGIDLARVFERTSRPVVEAVLIEAQRLLRRRTGYAPAGNWARGDAAGSFAVAIAEIPGRCDTCLGGCRCRFGSDGCAHLNCPAFPDTALANSCPGVAVLLRPRVQQRPARRGHLPRV